VLRTGRLDEKDGCLGGRWEMWCKERGYTSVRQSSLPCPTRYELLDLYNIDINLDIMSTGIALPLVVMVSHVKIQLHKFYQSR
jgi:hypothetical protein